LPTLPRQLPAVDTPIADADEVYRLIKVADCKPVDGKWEMQSLAFSNATPFHDGERDDEMSVVLQDTLAALGRVPDQLPTDGPFLGGPHRWGVARLSVAFLRKEKPQQDVVRSAKDEEPAHGDVRGRKPPACRKRIRKHATWVIEPQAIPE
jgi:hypothetical protein